MHRFVLIGIGGYALINAGYIWMVPEHWYVTVPGVQETGPLNLHLARDVALAFLSSAAALIWAGSKVDTSAAVCGVAWLLFHAIFHISIWVQRGAPADLIAFTNLAGIQLPAWLAAWAALHLHKSEEA